MEAAKFRHDFGVNETAVAVLKQSEFLFYARQSFAGKGRSKTAKDFASKATDGAMGAGGA